MTQNSRLIFFPIKTLLSSCLLDLLEVTCNSYLHSSLGKVIPPAPLASRSFQYSFFLFSALQFHFKYHCFKYSKLFLFQSVFALYFLVFMILSLFDVVPQFMDILFCYYFKIPVYYQFWKFLLRYPQM